MKTTTTSYNRKNITLVLAFIKALFTSLIGLIVITIIAYLSNLIFNISYIWFGVIASIYYLGMVEIAYEELRIHIFSIDYKLLEYSDNDIFANIPNYWESRFRRKFTEEEIHQRFFKGNKLNELLNEIDRIKKERKK